jgi:hypothetical protein
MPRWGYAVIAALALILAVYAFWPAPAKLGERAFPERLPDAFAITGALGEQQVALRRVRVAGLDRPADAGAISRLGTTLAGIRVPAERIVDGVDAAAARAWGVDGARRLVAGGEERAWGSSGEGAAVHDPRRARLYLIAPEALGRIARDAARLDRRALIPVNADPSALTVDGVRWAPGPGGWRAADRPRPPAAGRIANLLAQVVDLELTTIGAEPPAGATAVHRLVLDLGGLAQRLDLLHDGSNWWIAAEGAPTQTLTPAQGEALAAACAALAADRLLDPLAVPPLERVTIRRGAAEVLALARRGAPDAGGRRPWEVRWAEGAEPADEAAAERFVIAMLGLAVADALAAPEPASPDRLEIEAESEDRSRLRLVLAGGQAWADGWLGRPVALPPLLATPDPAACLGRRPCAVEAERIVRLQRRFPGAPARDEAYARAGGGSAGWTRTWPSGGAAPDAASLDRLVRALVRLRATGVRLGAPPDAGIAAELAVRIAPERFELAGEPDIASLDDTLPQDRLWLLARSAEGWEMADPSARTVYRLDEADAEALLAELGSRRVFALPPSLVSAIQVGGAQPFRLERRGDGWLLQQAGAERVADPVAARRLLRALLALEAGAPTAAPADAVAVTIETVDRERLSAAIGGGAAMTATGPVALDPAQRAAVSLDPAALAP